MGRERWGAEEFQGIRPRRDRKGWVLVSVFDVDAHPWDRLTVVVDELP